jgi:hypothetical protein
MIGSGPMAPLLKLREAVRLIGVSPGRLYRAIADGRLTAAPGGGPGKPTLVSLEALQAFCQSEGLRTPDGAGPLERSIDPTAEALAQQAVEAMAGQYLAQVMERQGDYFEAFLREELSHLVNRVLEQVVDQVAERLAEHLAAQAATDPERSSERSTPALPLSGKAGKVEALRQIRRLQGEGLSLQAIANRLNAEGIPTVSGKGRWQKGTISNLLAEQGSPRGTSIAYPNNNTH